MNKMKRIINRMLSFFGIAAAFTHQPEIIRNENFKPHTRAWRPGPPKFRNKVEDLASESRKNKAKRKRRRIQKYSRRINYAKARA